MCFYCSNTNLDPRLMSRIKVERKSISRDICPTCMARIAEHVLSATVKSPDSFDLVNYLDNVSMERMLGSSVYGLYVQRKYTLVSDDNVRYKNLTAAQLIRLMGHSLLPDEYRTLINAGHSANEYLLQDDFYDDDGVAYEPVSDAYYKAALNARIAQSKKEVDLLHKKQQEAIDRMYMSRHALRMLKRMEE